MKLHPLFGEELWIHLQLLAKIRSNLILDMAVSLVGLSGISFLSNDFIFSIMSWKLEGSNFAYKLFDFGS